jgi:hypothetical protein
LSVGSTETPDFIVDVRSRSDTRPWDANPDLQEVSCDLAQHYLTSCIFNTTVKTGRLTSVESNYFV